MYIKEISQDNIRGTLGSLVTLSLNVGMLIMYVIGTYLDYYTVIHTMIGLSILITIPIMKAPETPEFLVKQGKLDVSKC